MDKETQEKITEVLINMLLVEKTGVKLPLNHYALNIFTGLKELGYRKLPKGRPPLLGDKEVLWTVKDCLKNIIPLGNTDAEKYGNLFRSIAYEVAQAQRESDIKYYGGEK